MPQLCVCSAAARTIETTETVCAALGFPPDQIRKEARLHNPHLFILIEYIRGLTDNFSEVFLVNHNPAVTQCINYFGAMRSGSLHPGTAVCLRFKTDSWKEIEEAGGTPVWFLKS